MLSERELSTEEAYQRLEKTHKKLGLHAEVRYSGKSCLAATCHLYDKSYNEVSSGAGKGESCDLGALAESLEHYFIETSTPNSTLSDEILKSLEPFDDWLLKSIPRGCQLPYFKLESVERYDEISVPAIILAPTARNIDDIERTAAGFLTKYATNSGTALGCTENEALLHAINEAIERHALSQYYLFLCGLATAPKLYQPSESFLEETFAHDNKLFHLSKKLEILISHDFFDLPFCVAFPRQKKTKTLCTVGSGCSISPSIAMYRAVTEFIQCEELYGPNERHEDFSTKVMLSSSTRLASLVHPSPSCNVSELHPPQIELSIRGQIKRTLLNLKKHNKTVFYRTLYSKPELVTALQVFIPGLERFHLIRSGIPVAPQSTFKGIRQ